jgi:hypothetical protein
MSNEYPSKETKEVYMTPDNGSPVQHDPKERHHSMGERVRNSISVSHIDEGSVEGQIFSMNSVDPALDKKMRLVNAVSLILMSGTKSRHWSRAASTIAKNQY